MIYSLITLTTRNYTLENLYDRRNDREKSGFYYFDSRYPQDLAFEDSVGGKQIARVSYDWKNREALLINQANTSHYNYFLYNYAAY